VVKKVTENVYLIEHEEAANNVIIIGKKGVVLIDTSLFPEKAKKYCKIRSGLYDEKYKSCF